MSRTVPGSKAHRILQLSDMGMTPAEIHIQMKAEGYAQSVTQRRKPLAYIRDIIAIERGSRQFNMRLVAIERELSMIRQVLLDIANSKPSQLRLEIKKIQKKLETTRPFKAASLRDNTPIGAS